MTNMDTAAYPATADQRLRALSIALPPPPAPFGAYVMTVFGSDRRHCRLVLGVASLPLGSAVELELIVEVST
jgi:enamine deaminase RidA (YjgF/YER057c/UK114 family)